MNGNTALKKFSVAAVALCFAGTFAWAAEKSPSVGDEMPDFELTDYTGKTHKLSDYAGKIVVLECSSQNCPWSRGTDSHIAEMAKAYEEKGVVFLGIDSDKGNTPEAIAEHAKNAEVPFPILKDVDNKYADAIAAARTPEIYIVDKDGALVYHGAYDNRRSPEEKGDVQYVANALDELLAGKEVSTPKVSAWGCTIRRVTKNTQ
jgi:peroxiredoxin